MSNLSNKIEENIPSKWGKGFFWGTLLGIGLFFGALKLFPKLFETILEKNYVPRKEYESLKNIEKDNAPKNSVPKNSNEQIGANNSNTQN